MKNNKIKPSVKIALASTLVATSTVAIAYAVPKIVSNTAKDIENKFILDVENIDGDTVKVSLDNIEDIPRALQFSLKLDGVVLKEESGNPVIRDLVNKDNSSKIITDYSYNKDTNTIDVLITSEDYIPKNGNEIEVFELDIEADSKNESRNYTILPKEDSEYKYVSNTNKEYVRSVSVNKKELSINTAPIIERSSEGYIEINEGEVLTLTKDVLESKGIVIKDAEKDEVILEVKDVSDKVITKFTSSNAGIYDLYITAIDSFGEKSETLNVQVKVNAIEQGPIITRDGKELEDVIINAGQVFDLMKGIKAVDVNGNSVEVTVKSNEKVNLDPEEDSEYTITYTAIDSQGRTTVKEIKLTVKANKAPVISGVKDHTLTVGDDFDPKANVKVEDEDEDIELVINSNVNTSIAGIYKVVYSATDSGNKTSLVQSTVVVNPKMEEINSVPEINASDRVIELGEEFNPLDGVTATDAEDGPISKIDVVINEVLTDKPGKYKVTYSVTDSKGASTTKTINVLVNDPPQIKAEDRIIKLGEDFDPLSWVTAIDTEDGPISKIDVVENTVNTKVEGSYTVKYSVTDNHGAKATKTIKVTVKKNVILADSIAIDNKINNLYVGSSKILTATINKEAEVKDIQWTTSDENIASIEAIGNDVKVTAKAQGEVTITAKTMDGSNKSDSITINIVDYTDVVPEFIDNIIDSDIVIPVLGDATKDSPLEMEVQNVTAEKFDEFLEKLKDLSPILEEKYEDGNFTVYKIKVQRKAGLLELFSRAAKGADVGYIELRVENNLDNANELKTELEKVLNSTGNPGDGNNSGNGDNSGDGNNLGDGNNSSSGSNSGNGDSLESESDGNSSILPTTGGKSMVGYAVAGITSVLAGVAILKKKKK